MPRGKVSKSKTFSSKQKAEIRRLAKKQIRKDAEPKYHQSEDLSYSINSNATIFDMCNTLSQGTYATNRIGNKVQPTSYSIRGQIRAGDTHNVMRCVVFQWHEDTEDRNPELYDIFESTTYAQSALYSMFNRQQKDVSFTVLADRIYNLVSTTENPELSRTKLFKIEGYKRLKEISYNGFSTTGTGHIMVLWVSDSSVTPNPNLTMISHFNYLDL